MAWFLKNPSVAERIVELLIALTLNASFNPDTNLSLLSPDKAFEVADEDPDDGGVCAGAVEEPGREDCGAGGGGGAAGVEGVVDGCVTCAQEENAITVTSRSVKAFLIMNELFAAEIIKIVPML